MQDDLPNISVEEDLRLLSAMTSHLQDPNSNIHFQPVKDTFGKGPTASTVNSGMFAINGVQVNARVMTDPYSKKQNRSVSLEITLPKDELQKRNEKENKNETFGVRSFTLELKDNPYKGTQVPISLVTDFVEALNDRLTTEKEKTLQQLNTLLNKFDHENIVNTTIDRLRKINPNALKSQFEKTFKLSDTIQLLEKSWQATQKENIEE